MSGLGDLYSVLVLGGKQGEKGVARYARKDSIYVELVLVLVLLFRSSQLKSG